MVLNIVQWTSLFHRINPILLVRSDEFGDHVGRRGLQATDCAKHILPSPSSAPPAGAGIITRFFQNFKFLDYHLLLWRPNLSVNLSSGRRHRPRDFNLSLVRDKRLPHFLVLLLARELLMLGPETVVGTSDRVWPRT
jgi:hypothetical protein